MEVRKIVLGPATPRRGRHLEAVSRPAASTRRRVWSRLPATLLLTLFLANALPAQAGIPCIDLIPPEVEITSPARGAFIESASELVVVEGVATDSLTPLASLVVNGEEQLNGGGGQNEPFSVAVSAPWGLTIVSVHAEDQCGNHTEAVQAFLRSDAFYAAATESDPDAEVSGAILAHLNQPVFDDGDRNTVDDFATIAELAIGAFDFNDLPESTSDNSAATRRCTTRCRPCDVTCLCGINSDNWLDATWSLTRGPIQASDPELALLLENGTAGLGFDFALDTFSTTLSTSLTPYTCTLGVGPVAGPSISPSGSIDASAASATGKLLLSVDSGEAALGLEPPGVDVTADVTATVDCGVLQFVCDFATNLFGNQIEDLLVGQIEDWVNDQLNPSIEDLLRGVVPAASFDLPPPFDTTLDMDVALESAAIAVPVPGEGAADLGFATQLVPAARGAGIPDDAPGAPRHTGADPPFMNVGYELGVGVRDDLVNQLLWAIWYTGGFELPDLRAQLGSELPHVTQIGIGASLPPVLMPGVSPDRIQIGLGDWFVTATIDLAVLLGPPLQGEVTMEAFVSAIFAGTLGFDSARQALDFDIDTTTVESQVFATSAAQLTEPIQTGLEDAFGVAVGKLIESIVGAVAIPIVDLHDVDPGLFPAGTALTVSGGQADHPTEVATRVTGSIEQQNDSDGDGAFDSGDNCLLAPNPFQDDADADGNGNACDGDFNQDDFVGGPDFDIFLGCFNQAVAPGVGPLADPTCSESDMNGDGFVGGPDFDLFLQGFNAPPGPSAQSGCGMGWEIVPLLTLLGVVRRRSG